VPSPGLSFAQDMTYFHDAIAEINSLSEAREKRQEEKGLIESPPTSSLGPSPLPSDPPAEPSP
jgi:hypothetical protein